MLTNAQYPLLVAKRASGMAKRLSCPLHIPMQLQVPPASSVELYIAGSLSVCRKEIRPCVLFEKKSQVVLGSWALNLLLQFSSNEWHQLKSAPELWSLCASWAWILEGEIYLEFLTVVSWRLPQLNLYPVFQLMCSSSYHLDFNPGTQQWMFNNSIIYFLITVLRCNIQ